MKTLFNKQVWLTVAFAVILPIVVMMAMASVIQKLNAPPAPVPAVVDSGERWYNPFSWQNDELAAIAHQQAEAAQANSVGFTGSTVWMIMGFVGVGLALAYGANDVKRQVYEVRLTEAHKERPTPPQIPPAVVDSDSTGEDTTSKEPSVKHPAGARA